MSHFVRKHNLPHTPEKIKRMGQTCRTCAEVKPRYFRPPPQTLIKATKAWERLSIDFKGPVKGPSPYLL